MKRREAGKGALEGDTTEMETGVSYHDRLPSVWVLWLTILMGRGGVILTPAVLLILLCIQGVEVQVERTSRRQGMTAVPVSLPGFGLDERAGRRRGRREGHGRGRGHGARRGGMRICGVAVQLATVFHPDVLRRVQEPLQRVLTSVMPRS